MRFTKPLFNTKSANSKSIISGCLMTVFAFAGILFPSLANAEHPSAEKLLPEKTVVFIKIDDMKEFGKSFSDTSMMKMMRDEKMAPVVKSLYGSIEDAYSQAEETLGVSLGDLQNLIQGEACFALIAEKDEPLSVALFLDYSGNEEVANQLLGVGEERAGLDGAELDETEVGTTTIRSIKGGNDADEQVYYFQRSESFCLSNNEDLSKLLLARWMVEDGEELSTELAEELGEKLEGRTFNKNRKYLNIMKQCDGDEDNPPQASFFVDPFELIRATQTGVAGTAALGILRGLGVDGLLGIGGSMTMNHKEYESIVHIHVGLANPRSGIIKMLAIEPGDLEPEPIFPSNLANYATANWNAMTTFNEIEKIYDLFNGEGSMAEELEENFTENLGVDLKEDLIAAMEGRVSFGQITVDSGALNGQAVMIAVKLKDSKEFEDVLADLQDSIEELADRDIFLSEKYKGIEYYVFEAGPNEEQREQFRQRREDRIREAGGEVPRQRVQFGIRDPNPCIGIVGDYFIFTDSVDFMREAIKREKNPDDILADDPDYKQLLREIKRQLDGRKPAMITFQRPEETMRMLYDAIKNEQTIDAIKDRSEDQPFFNALQKAFVDNELPDFDDLAKYFPPAAGVMTNDETGFHYMTFSQKVEDDDE